MASMPVLRQFALPLAPAHCGLWYRGLALDTKGGQTTSFLERLRPCPFGLGFTVALDELLLRRRIERADQILQDRHGALTFVVEKGVHRSGPPPRTVALMQRRDAAENYRPVRPSRACPRRRPSPRSGSFGGRRGWRCARAPSARPPGPRRRHPCGSPTSSATRTSGHRGPRVRTE